MAESGGGGGGVEDAGCLPPSHTNNGGDGAGNLPPSHANGGGDGAGSTWEIEELEEPDDRPPRSVAVAAASTASSGADDDVYVAVGKGGSSMAALSWALRRLTKPRSFVYLVHVFPVVTSIPTPLGMMPKSQASPEQIETYLNQERSKRRQMLQKFLDQCRKFQEDEERNHNSRTGTEEHTPLL
ncbi:uncharacterized protein LOC8076418 isoform X2 [Sorghum bicolor]|uniref:uncharacterized protein LOC8076418 isoform X2 n=1 Tax=Sorghum bicolor TaxID=4558 RepID=UPI000B426A1D|nr:uncharacterized protein LOC8076418 isoform X2 [Sorghum bicolor]|eukprot:XP_021305855.1 uncharacterized protein LOC8076418 isoform X2 [Sorghum bicolor]